MSKSKAASQGPDNQAPEGFRWISNDGASGNAYITVDNQLRLYLSSGTRELLKIGKGLPVRLIVGYDYVNKRIVVAKPEIVRATDVKPFSFDKRSYGSARAFVRDAGIKESELPVRFNYVGKEYGAYPEGSYAFERDDD